jgi:hypothetical protein
LKTKEEKPVVPKQAEKPGSARELGTQSSSSFRERPSGKHSGYQIKDTYEARPPLGNVEF